MADIHIRLEPDGIVLWRTGRQGKGRRIQLKGTRVKVADKSGITKDLQVFQPYQQISMQLEESNGNIPN